MNGAALLLGGSGFLGRAMIDAVFTDQAVVVADLKPPVVSRREGLTYIPADFTRTDDFSALLNGVSVVAHLVSTVAPAEGTAGLAKEISDNLLPTVRLLDCMAAAPSKPSLLYISSGGTVYGECGGAARAEPGDTLPICAYGAHKLAIEKYIHLYHVHHGLDYRVARLANPYGARYRAGEKKSAVAVFIERMRAGLPVTVWGDGGCARDYIYIDDAMRALRAILAYRGRERVFNVGAGESVTVNGLISIIAGELGAVCPQITYAGARACDARESRLDIGLIKACTGWEPRIPLREGIRRCILETEVSA